MPPIPVHIDSPITPVKPQGITPKTAEQPTPVSSNNPTTTTAPAPNNQAYPAAMPGAAAVPAPTSYLPRAQPEATRTTQTVSQGLPPPPQPGAVPIPQAQQTPTSTLPPPPRAGEIPASTSQHTPFTSMLSQMHIPPPSQNLAPTHSTTTTQQPSTPARSGPTTLNMGPVASPSAGPPGYQQNAYAQDMTPAQRASLDQQEELERRRGSVLGGLSLGGAGAVGGAGGRLDGSEEGVTVGNVWNAVKGWANVAGEKAVGLEEEVWKRINK